MSNHWGYPKFWKLRVLMWKLLCCRKPKEVRIGQIWWDQNGHYSGANCRAIYITLGKKFDKGKYDYWSCACLHFYGNDCGFLGGGLDDKLFKDEELLSFSFLGNVPCWKLRMTIGSYKDYLLDRAWDDVGRQEKGLI